MGSPCDADVKWILRAGFNVDPSTLAKNLTILCTVAFSATVLYVVYSNSGKRPHSTDNIQKVCFLDEEERSKDDHTTQCETRCRHSIVGSSDGGKPPDSLMSFGISLEDVQSPSSRRACHLDSTTVDVDSTNDRLGDTGTLVACDPNATNDVGILDVMQDVKCSENSNAGTLNLPSIATSNFNSCDVSTVAEVAADGNMTITESSCTKVEPSATSTASGPDAIESSCTQVAAADGNMTITESPCTRVEPSATSTASGPDAIESSCTRTLPSTTTNTTLDGPIVMESTCTQTPPATTSTASGPDETSDVDRATGNQNDTSLCAPSSSGRALGPLSNSKCMSAGMCTSDQPCGLSNERSEVHKESRFTRENIDCHYDPGCARTGVDLLRKCEESESQRRSRIDFTLRDADSAGDLHWMEEEDDDDDDGSHFVGYIYGIIQEKGGKSYKRRPCEGVSIAKERMEQGQSDCFREKLAVGEKCGIRCQDSCTQIEGGRTCDGYGSTGSSQKIVEGVRKTNFDTVCKDKGTSTSVDDSFDSSAREACMGRPLKQKNTKENTDHLLDKTYAKCRDKGTSTSADTLPASRTKGPSTGRPLKHPRTMPKEETRHVINDNLDEFERCAEERRERGIPSVHSQPADPLEQTKRSLKALTETQHWSKMSLPEQYEYLGFLDSTLAAASAEWKRKWNVTYWRQKDSDSSPLPKQSGLSSLCKPQGSPKCPIPDMAHSCFQGEANGSNLPSSSGRQVEKCNVLKNGHQRQHWVEDTCVEEAQQITLEKQGNRQVRCQPSSSSTTCDTVSHKLSRSMPSNHPLDESKRSKGHVCPQTRNLHYEAARETLARARVLAKNSKYQCK